jgi:hypothetical protein
MTFVFLSTAFLTDRPSETAYHVAYTGQWNRNNAGLIVRMIFLQILLWIPVTVYLLLIYLWTLGALYFDAAQRSRLGWIYGVFWTLIFAGILLYLKPFWLAVVVVTALAGCVFAWWLTQKPSHDRDWDPSYAQLPEFVVDGDRIAVRNVRNNHYRTLQDYDCRYETRHYLLSELQAVDLIILYWGSNLMSHPMFVFDFGNHQNLCISIEVRYEIEEKYNILASLFRQNELTYVVSDERDAILRRSKFSEGQDCYLYRLQLDRDQNHEFLQEFIRETNSIYVQPRWYNALAANCTTAIYRQRRGKMSWDWRILFNGTLDKMLYDWGRLYTGLPFQELRKASWINERANAANEESFSAEIRKGLPGFQKPDALVGKSSNKTQ